MPTVEPVHSGDTAVFSAHPPRPPVARAYTPREPGESALVVLLRDHLEAFLEAAQADDPEWSLPAFVERQLRAVIACGDPSFGFVRLECTACRGPRVVPFSCKGRICPSCAGRRMNEQAAYLVDRVLPKTPYRQFVLTLPSDVARVVAFDATLAGDVFGAFADELARWQCAQAQDAGIAEPQAGCVLEIQRFADGARVWPHAHALVPEGVFSEAPDAPGGPARFHRLPPPTDSDIEALVLATEQRVNRVLCCWQASRPNKHPAGTQLLLQCTTTAPHEQLRIQGSPPDQGRSQRPRKPLCARSPAGLELHADVFVAAHDRPALERLCRYMARPPIPQDRLAWREDGMLVLSLKRTWKGGVRAIVFNPLALIARLAALVPAPYMHLRRFYGIFGPHHKLRARILPTPPDPATSDTPVSPKRPKSMLWADLLMRIWRIDALRCPHCGGRMRIIGAVRDPDAISAILAAIDSDRWADTARAPPETMPRQPQAA